MRNFIWNRDITHKKLVIVYMHQACRPTDEGGLGIRPLSRVNE